MVGAPGNPTARRVAMHPISRKCRSCRRVRIATVSDSLLEVRSERTDCRKKRERTGIVPNHPSLGLSLCRAKRRCFGAPSLEKTPQRVRIEQIHVSGTLSGAAPERGSRWQTGDQRRNLRISAALSRFRFPLLYPVQHRKGPAMANRRPTPQPSNFGQSWPPGMSGNPAGYSHGRRISDAIMPIKPANRLYS